MHDVFLVHVLDAKHHLVEQMLGKWLGKLLTLLEVVDKVSTRAELHYHQVVLICLENLELPHVVVVLHLPMVVNFSI